MLTAGAIREVKRLLMELMRGLIQLGHALQAKQQALSYEVPLPCVHMTQQTEQQRAETPTIPTECLYTMLIA